MTPTLYPLEARAIRQADALTDEQVVDELVVGHDVARHGYGTPDELRSLAAVCLVLARRLDARALERRA
jgi:hypothetical protein